MKEQRMFQRFRVEIPVKIINLDTNKEYTATIVDISAGGGSMIQISEELLPDMRLKLWLQIPDNQEALHVTGKVVWVNYVEANAYKAGIQFDKPDFWGMSRAWAKLVFPIKSSTRIGPIYH